MLWTMISNGFRFLVFSFSYFRTEFALCRSHFSILVGCAQAEHEQ